MSQALSAFGVQFKRAGTAILEVVKITGPGLKQSTKNVTNHDSVERWEEFIGTVKSADDVKISCNYIPSDAGQVGLMADFADGLAHAYEIVFPTAFGASWTFNALITGYEPGPFGVEDSVDVEITLKITGKPTLNLTLSTGLTTPFFAFTPAGTNVPAPSGTPGTFINQQLTGQASVTITPTAAAGVITVNGTVVATGQPSGPITLPSAGTVTPVTVVVKETGKVAKTYTILVARA